MSSNNNNESIEKSINGKYSKAVYCLSEEREIPLMGLCKSIT